MLLLQDPPRPSPEISCPNPRPPGTCPPFSAERGRNGDYLTVIKKRGQMGQVPSLLRTGFGPASSRTTNTILLHFSYEYNSSIRFTSLIFSMPCQNQHSVGSASGKAGFSVIRKLPVFFGEAVPLSELCYPLLYKADEIAQAGTTVDLLHTDKEPQLASNMGEHDRKGKGTRSEL